MKTETERIAHQLRRGFSGGAWHGPSVLETLEGIDEEKARARPVAGAHSIQEIVAHLVAWQEEPLRRLKGEGRGDLPPSEDWPEGSFRELVERLKRAHEELLSAVAAMDDAVLDELVKGRKDSVYVLLHGVVQHNLYHAGQIAILKKALS